MLVTSVTAIANMVVEAIGLSDVKFSYTGGNRGWRGSIPRVKFNMVKMKDLGWSPRYNSDEAVRQAIEDLVMALKA